MDKKDVKKVLEILRRNTFLSDTSIFCDRDNDDFMENIKNYFSYEYGATKIVLIPKYELNIRNYVIKIPYSGNNKYSYYLDLNGEEHEEESYEEFYNADCEEEPWNYCQAEVNRYKIAYEEGFKDNFAKTEYIGEVRGYPIYAQEKCTVFSRSSGGKFYSTFALEETSNLTHNYYGINLKWLTDFRFFYGDNHLSNFINFISNNEWDDDLRSDNLGYIGDRPVVIDYAGYYE